ncbi:ABC transporter permease [Fulvivirga sp.]|uniref:ABC transporter permease n=1 Tax=Fulvivirga sp. TaxID=1931237 RepID=UPI0032EF55D1
MIKNYLKITFRSLWKSKVFVLINIIGMGLAIACSIVAYLNFDFNANFDKNQIGMDNIYRINAYRTFREKEQAYGMSPLPLAEAVRENVGDVDDVMRYMPSGGNFKLEDELFNENFTFVDTNFFNFFTFNITTGDASALKDKASILISQRIVEKYFPEGDPMGKTLTHFTDKGPRDYKVAGIFEEQPLNSSFGGVRIITNIENFFDLNASEEDGRYEDNWENWVTTFVRVDNKDRIAAIEERLDANYLEIQNEARIDFKLNSYFLEPFEGMAYRAADDITYGHWLRSSMPPPAVTVPIIMAVLILLIACFNFTNTSMAIASKRLKEIGLRKVMGGVKSQLVIQFLLENLVLCFLSLVAGVIIALFLVPAYSEMWPFLDIRLSFDQNINFYLFLIGVLTFTGVIAGSYPAFYVTSFEPASILKGTSKFGGVNKMTNVLLTLQFSISLIAIILGVVFYQNAIYQKELDYGYDLKGAISVYFDDIDSYKSYENVVRSNPQILSFAGSEYQIDRGYRNDPIKNADKEYDADILHIGDNFFETMDFKLLDGRGFRKDSETDMKESVIVSQEMVKVFGWEEPLGQKLIWMDTVPLYVVGVMQDAYTDGLWAPISPLMLRYVPEEDYHYLTIKASSADLIKINEYLEGEWKTMFPDKMYTGQFMDEELSEASLVNANVLKMFGFLGVIATFMSVIGLFSIVSLNILKRMKEVGVRKVLGASVGHLMTILNKNFIIILLIASVIGSILSYMMAGAFMEMIWTYHVDPGVMSFASSILLLLVIAMATISIKVYKAATASPTETIRTE